MLRQRVILASGLFSPGAACGATVATQGASASYASAFGMTTSAFNPAFSLSTCGLTMLNALALWRLSAYKQSLIYQCNVKFIQNQELMQAYKRGPSSVEFENKVDLMVHHEAKHLAVSKATCAAEANSSACLSASDNVDLSVAGLEADQLYVSTYELEYARVRTAESERLYAAMEKYQEDVLSENLKYLESVEQLKILDSASYEELYARYIFCFRLSNAITAFNFIGSAVLCASLCSGFNPVLFAVGLGFIALAAILSIAGLFYISHKPVVNIPDELSKQKAEKKQSVPNDAGLETAPLLSGDARPETSPLLSGQGEKEGGQDATSPSVPHRAMRGKMAAAAQQDSKVQSSGPPQRR